MQYKLSILKFCFTDVYRLILSAVAVMDGLCLVKMTFPDCLHLNRIYSSIRLGFLSPKVLILR